MKGLGIFVGTIGASALVVSLAFANPALLPKHPGYPAKGKSPVTGQPVANDQGQTNAAGTGTLLQAATSLDKAAINDVHDPNRMRIKQSQGAGRLPIVDSVNQVNPNPAGVTSTKIQ